MNLGDSIDKNLLQTFVPINALTDAQLNRLLETQELRHFKAGDTLFDVGESDNRTLYLLTGTVRLTGGEGDEFSVSAGDLESWHPLDAHQPRRRKAVAKSDVTVVSFDSTRLDNILAWDQSAGYVILDINTNAAYRDDREWMIRLLKSRLFHRVPPSNILQIFQRLRPLRKHEGDAVIRQGDPADCCYIIKEGLCEVSILAEGASEPTSVAMLEAGEWFGEDALLSGKPRNATITMATEGVLMRLDRSDFDELLREPVVRQIGADQAQELMDKGAYWLDVRTADEFEAGHLEGALNMPLNVLRLKSRLLQNNKSYVVCCDTGRRSTTAAFLLSGAGLDVYVLDGGLNAQAGALASRQARRG